MIIHLAFIGFVVFGAFTVLLWRQMVWLHIPAFAWGTMTELFGLICPLTHWENYFRLQGAGENYSGDFIAHYLLPVIYPAGLTREVQWMLAVALILTNLVAYAFVWRQYRIKKG